MSLLKRDRKLLDKHDVFSQNAWDDFDWTQDMVDAAKARIEEQISEARDLDRQTDQIESNVGQKWNSFYQSHGDKFFKDRKWILSEFQEIIPHLEKSQLPIRLLEVGCGVGNAVVQFLEVNQNNNIQIFCCDLSRNAIDILKSRQFYLEALDRSINVDAFQADIYKDFDSKVQQHIEPKSLDFITLVFTLSALDPKVMPAVIRNLASLLKPGGMFFFRDYAQYDLTQLRFKGKSLLGQNYYVRADGTTSYFFTLDLVAKLFESADLEKIELKHDNRLLVNRLKSIKMCRCWIQAKYRKPHNVNKDNLG